MANDDDFLLSCGSGEPKSPTHPEAPTPGASTQVVGDVPVRPRPGYDKDGVIDTLMLGSEKIGIQTGRNGPAKQKFLCGQCRKRRWIIDSDAGCAAEMTRFTICSFCDVRGHADWAVRKQSEALLAELRKVQEQVNLKLASFEAKLTVIENGSQPPAQSLATPTGLRKEFESLRVEVLGDIRDIRSKVKASGSQTTPSVNLASSGRLDASSTSSQVEYIEDMYRRVVCDQGTVKVQVERAPLAKKDGQTEVDVPAKEGNRTQRRKKSRKKKRRRGGRNVGQSQEVNRPEREKPVTLLIGDSIVGRAAGVEFSSLDTCNRVRSFPGAGVKRVLKALRTLEPGGRNTLVLAVGGNDFFRKDRRPCNEEALLKEYKELIRVARSKTSRGVIVGLTPRKFFANRIYKRACEVNRKLGILCKEVGFKFVNPWDEFFGVDRFYVRDGIHLSDQGSRIFARMVSHNLYGPPRNRRSRHVVASRMLPRWRDRRRTASRKSWRLRLTIVVDRV